MAFSASWQERPRRTALSMAVGCEMAAVSMAADQETENGGTWEVRL